MRLEGRREARGTAARGHEHERKRENKLALLRKLVALEEADKQ